MFSQKPKSFPTLLPNYEQKTLKMVNQIISKQMRSENIFTRKNFINELNSLLSFDLYREKLSKRYAEMEKRGQLGQRNTGAKKTSQVEIQFCHNFSEFLGFSI